MRFSHIAPVALAAVLAACSAPKQPETVADAPTFHAVMRDRVDANADALWDIANRAIGDDAGIDPARMTDDSWAALAQRADAVQAAAQTIAMMDPITVAAPGVKIADEGVEGGHSAEQVQAQIMKDPVKLRAMADVLGVHMADLAKAARAHDAQRTALLVNQLDGVCESCHLEFWYPSQKKLIEEYGISTE